MRPANNQKRYQRSRPSGNATRSSSGRQHNRNTSFESNGPNVRVRGTAPQLCEKYQQYARDAMSNGDFVLKESYLQHAEHYFRMFGSLENPASQNATPQNPAPAQQSEGGADNQSSQNQTSASAAPATPVKAAQGKTRRRRWELTNQNTNTSDGAKSAKSEGNNAFNGEVPAFLGVQKSADSEDNETGTEQSTA